MEANKYNEVCGDKLIINTSWCKGCGICTSFCIHDVLTIENEKVKVVNEANCIECGLCELRCPDYAIYLRRNGNGNNSKVNAR